MSDERAAAVYAAALFEAATEGGVVERVRRDLDSFAAASAASEELRRALFDPQIPTVQKERVVAQLVEGAHPLVGNLVRLLLSKGRLGLLGPLTREFDRLAQRAAGVVEVEVVSAVALPDRLRDELMERLQARTGRTVRLAHRVEPAVLGGLSLRVGDGVVVDASLKARLERLREKLAGVATRGASE